MAVKRVLLVDYDPKSLSHARSLLQGAGFDVSTCGDGLSAIDQFKSETPDLVLLSAMLPKMHGFEVCSNIRKLPGGESTPVVIITDVYKGKRYRTDAIQKYGATEYIEKPIEDSNLVSILQELVKNNGAAISAAAAPAESLDEKTVQFNRDALLGKLAADERVHKPAGEKKNVSEKPKSKDEMERKLEQSLAGLDLGKSRPKPKPAAPAPVQAKPAPAASPVPESPATVVIQKDSASGSQFTSEDLFTDVIASVERELQSEKLITNPGLAAPRQPAATIVELPVPSQPPPPPAPPKPVEAHRPHEPAKKGMDSDLEKKLTNTLSGLIKDKPAAHSKTVSIPTPKAEPPKVEPAKPAPAAAKPVEPPAAKPAPSADAPATVMLTKESVLDAVSPMSTDGINFGQYLLLSKIATGGMAELFKAKRKGVEGFEKILAIKRILPHMSDNEEFITMFIDEAKLAAQLSHHNICQIFDLGKIENSYYIAMEYVHGKDLRAVLKAARSKNKTVPVELAVLITSKICSALDYAHRKRDANGQPLNLVHRDVSPQNILISYEGDVKLVDFGIAKAATKVHVTQHGALKGKLLYMSPEQAWGRSVDRRSDIFSVAVVLYEMLSGRPLFFEDNDTEVTILEKVREARIVPIRDINAAVSTELEKIILKGLHKKQEERYQVASEMQKDLDNLFYTEGFNATSASLATFARGLFPEEWGQESGSKDTLMIDKESSDAMRAALPAAAAKQAPVAPPAPAKAPAPSAPAPAASKPAPAPQPAPEPVAAKVHQEAPKTAAAPPQPKAPEPAPAAPSAGFRDISMPEIIPTQPEKSNTTMIFGGIIALVVAVGAIAFFLFRSPAQRAEQQPAPPAATPTQQPQQKQQAPAPAPSPESATPAPATTEPVPVATTDTAADKLKQDLEKKIEEERLKLEKIQADDKARKAEEERKKVELAKLQEQQKAQQQKPPEPEPEPAKVEPVAVQEQPVAAEPVPPEPEPQPEPVQPQADPVPAVPQVNEGDLVELTPDVMKPSILSRVEPSYPPVARNKKVEGTVILSVLVAETGNVADVKVLREAGGSMGLNEAAITAVKKWKFRPAVKSGKRVKVWVTYPIVFKVQ